MDVGRIAQLLTQIERGKSAHDLESATLDFKAQGRSIRDFVTELAEDSVCFANAQGGTIVVGVRNAPGGADAFSGTDLDAQRLRTSIHDLTSPSLLIGVREIEHAGARLLVLDVPEGLEVHSTTQGGFRQRWNVECLPMSPADVSRLADERRGNDWSAAASTARVADIEPRAMETARLLLASSTNSERRALASRDTQEILARLGLLCDHGDLLTRAGAILFVERSDISPHESVIYQHRRTAGGEADFSRRWSSPLVVSLTEAFEVISSRLNVTPVNLSTGQQIALEDYPAAAVREALANALIHRDYREREPVQIVHSPQRLSIVSPGPLVSGVTSSNILIRGTKPRYPLLARACNEMGLVEYLGLGVNRMFREMARTGRSLPIVESRRDSVRVALEGGAPNVRVARLMATLPDDLIEDTDALLTIVALREKRSVTAKGLTKLLQKDEGDVETVLRRMSAQPAALIEPSPATRSRRHPSYHLTGKVLSALGSSVSYHTRTRDEVDRKVIDHVRDFDVINNAALQRMLDVDVYAARDILKDLVTREVLVRTSTQTRGKAVRYGKGPRFPKDSRALGRPERLANDDPSEDSGDDPLW